MKLTSRRAVSIAYLSLLALLLLGAVLVAFRTDRIASCFRPANPRAMARFKRARGKRGLISRVFRNSAIASGWLPSRAWISPFSFQATE